MTMPKSEIAIKQNHYGKIVIDYKEKDIIQIWNFQINTNDVIQIERGNIAKLIEILEKL